MGEAGLSPEILVHEMELLRQRRQWGPLAPIAAGGSYLAAMLRGQDPTVFSGWEYPAYEQQARSLARQRAEVAARRGR